MPSTFTAPEGALTHHRYYPVFKSVDDTSGSGTAAYEKTRSVGGIFFTTRPQNLYKVQESPSAPQTLSALTGRRPQSWTFFHLQAPAATFYCRSLRVRPRREDANPCLLASANASSNSTARRYDEFQSRLRSRAPSSVCRQTARDRVDPESLPLWCVEYGYTPEPAAAALLTDLFTCPGLVADESLKIVCQPHSGVGLIRGLNGPA